MASFIKSMTQLGGGSRQIARLLQAKAPPNHILAYITPEEADFLEARGGSGEPDPETGIPTFQEEDPTGGGDFTGEDVGYSYDQGGGGDYFPEIDLGQFAPAPVDLGPAPTEAEIAGISEYAPMPDMGAETAKLAAPAAPVSAAKPPEKPGGDDFLKRLAMAGVSGLFGARQARAAQKAGQAGAEEQRALARPYQEQGRALQQAAQRGELNAVGQQSLQALRARLAQGAQGRGGVGVAQAMQQVEAFRQRLLQQQYDFGLKLSQIGDQYALGAIRTGMQADQYVNNLTNQFFTNIARTLFSQQPAQQPRPPGG
jgi:hypothetical protein